MALKTSKCFTQGCCKWFNNDKFSTEYEPIVGSTETTLTKTVVADSEKQPLKSTDKVKYDQKKLAVATEAHEDLHYEHDLLYYRVLSHDIVKYAAIISYPDGTVKAANFPVRKKGIKNIISTFQGNSEPLAHYGIKISSELPVYSPGKMDKDKAIYGTTMSPEGENAQNGGCTIMKSKTYILVATYRDSEHFNSVEKIIDGVIKQLIADGK